MFREDVLLFGWLKLQRCHHCIRKQLKYHIIFALSKDIDVGKGWKVLRWPVPAGWLSSWPVLRLHDLENLRKRRSDKKQESVSLAREFWLRQCHSERPACEWNLEWQPTMTDASITWWRTAPCYCRAWPVSVPTWRSAFYGMQSERCPAWATILWLQGKARGGRSWCTCTRPWDYIVHTSGSKPCWQGSGVILWRGVC